jgi:hypothetical protein
MHTFGSETTNAYAIGQKKSGPVLTQVRRPDRHIKPHDLIKNKVASTVIAG